MAPDTREVLVVPKQLLPNYDVSFVPWQQVETLLGALERAFRWFPRESAERSTDWVQPIPVTLLRDKQGRYCVLRRTMKTRHDLRGRLTLVIGGHIERSAGLGGFTSLLETTLRHELYEEVGLTAVKRKLKPIGIVVDPASLESSRHVAFLFEVTVNEAITNSAPEEFAQKSKYNGEFMTVDELTTLHRKFDPWSTLILQDYVNPSLRSREARQRYLPIE